VATSASEASAARVAANETRHIFISFASEDLEVGRRVVEKLERSGFRCWISERDIEPAASYPTSITDAIADSAAVLLLLTPSANASPHVLREIELAFNGRAPILPVRFSGVVPSSDLAYFLSTTQWLDAGSTLDEAELQRVAVRLRELLQTAGAGRRRGIIGLRPRPLAAFGVVVVAAAAMLAWNARSSSVPASVATVPATVDSSTGGESATNRSALAGAATVKVNSKDGQAYIWVPPGPFVMGCSTGDPACEDDEKPSHAVDIVRGFWLSRTEVTRGQYVKAGNAVSAPGGENLPVTGVNWAAAKAYCMSIGGRLPSEAEWEYAARAGTTQRYYGALPAIAWFTDNAGEQIHPVGTRAPNAFGLHDMLGNVSEWVRDRYYNAYDDTSNPEAVEEPLAGNASGVARGGSWVSDASGVRVSRRLEMLPDAEESHIGFRCAIDRL
jgi:formylglycine-generating enzyme required for sulfatase activity